MPNAQIIIRHMRILLALMAVITLSASAQVRLTVRTVGDRTTFHIGELIPLELSYATAARGVYEISNASYDRSGRLGIEEYRVTPKGGWDDPLESYFRSYAFSLGGGLSSSSPLTDQAAVFHSNLNEWVRFQQPGVYRVSVSSGRVGRLVTRLEHQPEKVESNEIALTIVPATPEWEDAALAKALQTIGDPNSDAAAVLRYLGTPAAVREMARRLDDSYFVQQFRFGLAAAPSKANALGALRQLLLDPDYPIDDAFLDTMALVAVASGKEGDLSAQRDALETKFRGELLEVLGTKRGKALAVSAYAIVDEAAMHGKALPDGERARLTAMLVAGFDALPPMTQMELMQSRSAVLDQAAMLPLLSKIAQGRDDVSAAALQRWWEMDPDAARPAIIREINRSKPRFGARILGILPDKELPEADATLARDLTGENGNPEAAASLIARYATSAIEPDVLGFLDTRLGKLECAIQAPLLAYALRVNPSTGAALVKKAIETRGAKNSACNHALLTDVATLENDPALEEIALHDLQDSDLSVMGNAAIYLGRYGSAASEQALWTRLAEWSNAAPKDTTSGRELMEALATAQGWLSDDAKLHTLVELAARDPEFREPDSYLRAWEHRPRQVVYLGYAGTKEPWFGIAQYQPHSTDAAIQKLLQFPRGSRFEWRGDLKQSQQRELFDKISKAAAANEITVSAPPQ